ncbi:ABC transporter substrate-binding protein [Pseudonocardia benzenivorans]
MTDTTTSRPRRRLRRAGAAAAALLALAVGACSGPSQDTRPGNTDVATGGTLFATADEATAAFGADVAPGVFPRTITHAAGTTRLEKKPQRIAVLDSGELDDVIALGLTPVVMANPNNTPPSYLAEKTAGTATAGDTNNLNLEAIAAARPDLILGSKLRADQLYDRLSAIAPTVFSIRPGFPWKENFLLVGAATGEEDAAVRILNDYQHRADEVRSEVAAAPRPSRWCGSCRAGSGSTATSRSSASSCPTSGCRGRRPRTSTSSPPRSRPSASTRPTATGSSTPATGRPSRQRSRRSWTARRGRGCPRCGPTTSGPSTTRSGSSGWVPSAPGRCSTTSSGCWAEPRVPE